MKVPALTQAAGDDSPKVYPVASIMTDLAPIIRPKFKIGLMDPNNGALCEAARLLSSRELVEEYLAAKIWPLGAKWKIPGSKGVDVSWFLSK